MSKKLDAAIDALVDALAELPEQELKDCHRGNRLGLRILCELARRYPGIMQVTEPVRPPVGLSALPARLSPLAFPRFCERLQGGLARRLVAVRRVPSDPAKWNCWRWGLGKRRGQHPTALSRLLGWPIVLPERMCARRAPSSGEAGRTTSEATHDPVVAGPNAGTRITTRHVNPTPPAAFALNSAKASTVLLCCCGARVCKSYNREKADDRQIAHCICPSVDGLRDLFAAAAHGYKFSRR
jgi:hypothetical protein